jgi:hypothetical protein
MGGKEQNSHRVFLSLKGARGSCYLWSSRTTLPPPPIHPPTSRMKNKRQLCTSTKLVAALPCPDLHAPIEPPVSCHMSPGLLDACTLLRIHCKVVFGQHHSSQTTCWALLHLHKITATCAGSRAQHSTTQHGALVKTTARKPLGATCCESKEQNNGCLVNTTAQHSTAQHSTAQHSTAQHSTAQHRSLVSTTARKLPARLCSTCKKHNHARWQYNRRCS